MTLIDLISLSLLFRTGAKGKGTWDFKLQLPVAGSFVSEFRLGPPPGMKAHDVQGEDADDEDDDLMAGFAKQHGGMNPGSKKKKGNPKKKQRRCS